MKVDNIPKIIVGLALLISGLTIIFYGIFSIIPSGKELEDVVIWAIILIIGLALTLSGYYAIDRSSS